MSMDMEQNDTTRIPVHATQKTEDYRAVFLHCLNNTYPKIKLKTTNVLFHEDKAMDHRHICFKSPAASKSAFTTL